MAKWSPGKHPRDSKGQFKDKAGGGSSRKSPSGLNMPPGWTLSSDGRMIPGKSKPRKATWSAPRYSGPPGKKRKKKGI